MLSSVFCNHNKALLYTFLVQSFALYFPRSNRFNRNIFSCWYDSVTKSYDVSIFDLNSWPGLIILDSPNCDEVDGTSLSSFKVGFFALTEGMVIFTAIMQIDHFSFVLPTWRYESFDMDSFVDDVQSNLINEHDESESISSDDDEGKKVMVYFKNFLRSFKISTPLASVRLYQSMNY